jgi:hypothetical protein
VKAKYRPKPFTSNPKYKEAFDRQKFKEEAYIGNDRKMYGHEFFEEGEDEPIEWDEALYNEFQESLFKFIDYSDEEEGPTKEEIDEERRRFSYYRKGHKVGRLRVDNKVNTDTLLTAPMIFYILLTPHSSKRLGKVFNVHPDYIKKIKAGDIEYWKWEYELVKRITNKLRNRSINRSYLRERTAVYILWKRPNLYDEDKELIYVCSSESAAKKVRKEMAKSKKVANPELAALYYPIEKTYLYR